jgi:tetratricopeptide (TPR) repeat protein
VRRQQRLGEVAHANGDLATARSAFSNVLEKGRHSVFVTPGDLGNLCRVQVEQGDLDAAADTLMKNKSALQDSPEGQLVMAVTQSMVHAKSGNAKQAEKALDAAAELRASGVRGDARLMLDLAETCMASGRHDEADSIVSEVARNAHDSEALLAKARQIYDAAGRTDAGASVLALATADVRKLNNEGVMLAQRGDFKTAVDKLRTACAEAPHNPRILMNAVWVTLKYIDQAGMDEALIETARRYLVDAERQAPGHARIAGLRQHLSDVETRFGIRRKAAG